MEIKETQVKSRKEIVDDVLMTGKYPEYSDAVASIIGIEGAPGNWRISTNGSIETFTEWDAAIRFALDEINPSKQEELILEQVSSDKFKGSYKFDGKLYNFSVTINDGQSTTKASIIWEDPFVGMVKSAVESVIRNKIKQS